MAKGGDDGILTPRITFQKSTGIFTLPNRIGEIHRELHSDLPPEPALRAKAVESVLVEKGLLPLDAVDNWLENFAEKIGPKNGATVIALNHY